MTILEQETEKTAYQIGAKFLASKPVGETHFDALLATFTITNITKTGLLVAEGVVSSQKRSGGPFRGFRRRTVKFKAVRGSLVEHQPDMKTSYWSEASQRPAE